MEDFDLAGTGEFGKVDGASAADAGGGGIVGGDRGKLGQELAGVDEDGRLSFAGGKKQVPFELRWQGMPHRAFRPVRNDRSFICLSISSRVWAWVMSNSATAVRRRDSRWAPEPRQLAHFVGYGTHVGSRGYSGAEVGAVALDIRR